MLTVPKLVSQPQIKINHMQSALPYSFPTSLSYLELDFTPDDFYIKSQIPAPNSHKGK